MRVVEEAAKLSKWEKRSSPRPGNARTGTVSGRGISCVLYEGNNGSCAAVAEVDVTQSTGAIVVKNLHIANDCGPISTMGSEPTRWRTPGVVRLLGLDNEKATSVD
jgi:CO/xanthine dehydrogenase Mo-binding subunit